MRNLKRVLSLVMAVAMLIGLMVVSASAASTYDSFTDKDEIVNQEAVNTLVSLGVLNGKEDGSYFAPADIVTRAEMAKIITVCLNGGNDPLLSSAVANTGFSDVSSNYWAAPYIAYCANIGIINGKGDGTFGPEEPVTGTAAAKMFLCALGYRADIEGLTGANWALNTEQLANEKGLYNDMSIVPSSGLSRDNTAQLVYNGIQAQEVEYRNNYGEYSGVIYAQDHGTMLANRFGVVKVEGVVIANEIFGLGSTATPAGKARFVDTNTYTTANNTNGNYNGVYPVSIDNEYVGQRVVIYVKFPNALAPNATDCVVIGEPILSDKNTVATTGDRMKDTDAVKTFLRDNGLAIGTESATPTVAGTYFQGVKTLTKGDSAFADARPTLADGVNATAGRKMTFIDHTGDGTVDYIITENPTLAQVTVYNDTDKELTIAGEGSLSFKEIANPEAVAKGDMALYVKYDDTFYLSKPETVTGEVTAYINGTPKKVTMDGTNYTASANGLTKTGTTLETLDASQDLIGNSYIFYLDAYGNVVAKDLYEEEFGNYALVIDSAAGTADGTNLANSGEVKLMTNDGTTAVYKVNMLASAAKFEAPGTTDNAREQWMANMLGADGSKDLQYKIVTYVVDGSNVTIGNPGVLTNYGNVYGNSANPVQRSTASYNITDANGVTTNVIVNDNTLFYVMSDSDNNGIVDRFSLIQGLSNVPVSVFTGATVIGAAYQARTVDNHTTNTAKAVVVQDLQNSFKGTRSFVYVTGNYTQTNDQVKNNIYQYPVVFEDGETGSILVKNTTNATIETGAGGYSAIKSGMIYEYRMNGDYAELYLTSSTYNNFVTSQVSGKSMEIREGTNGANKDTKTLGTTVINVEDTSKIYVMDSEPTAAMSVAFATNSDGYVNLVFVRDSGVHFRTVYNTTGTALMINDVVIPNGGSIQVANGFDLTIKKADGSAIGAANASDQVVIYAHNDNSKDSGYETGDINSLGYGVITMPANSTVLLGSITGNKTFSTTIPDGSDSDTDSSTASGIIEGTVANVDTIDAGYNISKTGAASITYTVDVPEYIPDGAKVTVKGDLSIDGAYDRTLNKQSDGTVKDGKLTIRDTLNGNFDTEWKLSLSNVTVEYDMVKVEYKTTTGETLAVGVLADNTTASPTTMSTTAGAFNFRIDQNLGASGRIKVTSMTGATTDTTLPATTGTAMANNYTLANAKANGTSAVVITVDITGLSAKTYNITTKSADSITGLLGANSAPAGVTIDNFKTSAGGANTASTDKLGIYTTLANNSSITKGTDVGFYAKLGGTTDNSAYKVTVDLGNGDTFTAVLSSTTAVYLGSVKGLARDIEIAKASITVDPINTTLTGAEIGADGKSVTLTFNYDIESTWDKDTADLGMANATGVTIDPSSVTVSGKTISFTLLNALPNGATFTPAAAITGTTDGVTGIACDAGYKATVTLADSVYSIAVATV